MTILKLKQPAALILSFSRTASSLLLCCFSFAIVLFLIQNKMITKTISFCQPLRKPFYNYFTTELLKKNHYMFPLTLLGDK